MTTSNRLIVESLSAQQRLKLAEQFSTSLDNSDSINGLMGMLDVLTDDAKETVSTRVSERVIADLTEQTSLKSLESLISLLVNLSTATETVLQWVYDRITTIVDQTKTLLLSPVALSTFEQMFQKRTEAESTDISLEYILCFLENIYSYGSITATNELDKLTLFLLSVEDDKITTRATKVLRWTSVAKPSLHEFSWDMIFSLSRSHTSHVTAAFILWLRFLIELSKTGIECPTFQQKAQLEEYWSFIQIGLTSSVHEHRKYSLSILKLTLQQLTVDVDNSLITFKQCDKVQQIEDWKRFATLYEIIGVDTALNQAIAAHADLIHLLSPASHINASWGMALLCTGFKGNMEAVRKYSLELMLSVPEKNLCNFAHPFLTQIFLKYAMEGSHYQVKKVQDTYSCVFGERLESFVSSLIKSLKGEVLLKTVTELIDLLVEIIPLYDPSRIYLASGVLKGLKGKQILDSTHCKQIYKLFESTSEDDVYQTTLQTIHLRLLRHINSDVPLLLESLTRFVQFNGYKIYNDNMHLFLDYVAAYYDQSPVAFEQREAEFQVVYYSLFDKCHVSDEFLKELAYSGMDVDAKLGMDFGSLLGKLVKSEAEDYEKTVPLAELSLFKNAWSSVDLKPLYDALLSGMDLEKLEFFSRVFTKVSEVTDISFFQFEQLVNLPNIIKTTIPSANFKVKDSYSGAFLAVLLAYSKMNPLSDSELSSTLDILTHELKNGNYLGFKQTCHIIQHLLRQYESVDLITIVEILESVWDHITGDRLILSQRDMHMVVIETLFDERLLKDTINNEYNGRVLKRIGLDVVQLAQTRRCLLPCLSKKLVGYQRAYYAEFEQTEWIVDVLLAVLTMIQENSGMFRIKNVIAAKFDKELALEGDIYSAVYGEREVSAKVHVISILSSSSTQFCDLYAESLMNNHNFLVPVKTTDGHEELQRVLALASLLLISKKCSSLSSISLRLMPLLETETSPWIRSFMEWIVSLDLVSSPKNRSAVFQMFKDQGKPVLVTSAERIAFLVCQKLTGDEAKTYLDEFTKHLIPNCASNKPLVRHFSNSLILSLYPEIQKKDVDLPVNGILEMLYNEAQKSAVTGKYRTGDALLWDIEEDFNLVGIFGGVLARISPRELEVTITEKDFKSVLSEDLAVPVGTTKLPGWAGNVDESEKLQGSTETSPLQTKSGAWESVLDIDENVRNVKRSDLIVVSSLVDKPPNLGGICRLCDVLGAGLMTVDDMRVKKHPQFKSVAVTADYWMPMEEVNIGNIAEYMKQKKREGYTLIGLEQTDKSIVLGKDTQFPPKSLFLLGKEAEGIPGDLLAELDYCVEIRQLGVIRSMNIQTATAVLVHAYSSSLNM